jgi:YidC/Oxa1 family membrane protein insertase
MPVDLWNGLIVFPLINALVFLHQLLRDFGLAIVFLTLALRFALYPLFLTQLRSQRIMQELQPAVAELRRKYKGDRQKFAEEQMRLYRERGHNPAAGCLPLLVQFPILIGLWSALQQVGCGLGPPPDCPGLAHEELQKILYPFVPNPVPENGQLDATAYWLPWVTNGLAKPEPDPWKILAVLAGLTQFVASLMTLPAKQQATDDPMQRSMQMMVYYLPLITVFFAWSLPAGLALYWVTSTLFQIAQQYLVSGWGKLAVFLPFLRRLPSPAERRNQTEPTNPVEPKVEAKATKEHPTYEGAANGEPVEGRRRRRKRRGRR